MFLKKGTALISLNGAPGDHLSALPALRQLPFARLILSAYWRGGLIAALYEHQKLFDKFVWLEPTKMADWTPAQIGEYMLQQVADEQIDKYYDLNGYSGMVTPEDEIPVEDLRELGNRGNIYDRYCEILDVHKGNRPTLRFSEEEVEWVVDYCKQFPRLVGWQWSGSSKVKEFPRSEEVIMGLLEQHPDIHVVTMGSKRFSERHIPHERCTNLAGVIKWRQAALLTSVMDLYIAPDTSIMVAAQGFKKPKILLATTSGSQIAFPETQIIQSRAACSPCYQVIDTCDVDDCCGKIDDQAIYDAANNILK